MEDCKNSAISTSQLGREITCFENWPSKKVRILSISRKLIIHFVNHILKTTCKKHTNCFDYCAFVTFIVSHEKSL